MATVVLPFIALYLAVFLLMTGVGLLGTYLPLQLAVAGVSGQVIGIVTSAYFLGMLTGAFVCQRLIHSVGHIRSFAAFAATMTAVVMLHGFYLDPLFWGILRFAGGIATTGLYMVIESWLNECTQPRLRGKVMAVYMVISYLGMAMGQQFLNIGNALNLPVFHIVGIALALCLVPVTLTHSIHPQLPDVKRIAFTELLRTTPAGVLGCLCAGLLSSAFYAIAPVFGHEIGLAVSELTMMMTAAIAGGMALQWPIGTLSDRFDRTYVLIFLGVAVAVISLVIFLVAERSYVLFLMLMTLFGGLAFTLYPVAVARAHDLFEARDIVPVSSALLVAYGAGAVSGPLLASSLMAALGSAYGLYLFFALAAGSYAFVTFLMRRHKVLTVVPAAENSDFVALKSTSPVAAAILAPDEEELATAGKEDGTELSN